ncbi:MAG: HD domain-containing protein [Planctomycetota bacterium]|jgi:putative nucleotidyltransferase with HDIG domain|nr:HD domain-containing protein [Planctomycetota bacterium]
MDMEIQVVNETGRRFFLRENSLLTFGSGREADGSFNQPGISRLHCSIENHDGKILIRDMCSDDGTFVNGVKLSSETTLTPGDTISMGPIRLRITEAESGTAPDGKAPVAGMTVDETSKRMPSKATSIIVAAPGMSSVGTRKIRDGTSFQPTRKHFAAAIPDLDTLDSGSMFTRSLNPDEWGSDDIFQPEMRRLREHLHAVFLLSDRLQEQMQERDIIETATMTIFDVTRADNAAMILMNLQDKRLIPVCSLSRLGDQIDKHEFTFSHSVVNRALKEGVIVFTNSTVQNRQSLEMSFLIHNIQSVMCVPILSDGLSIGTFYVDRRDTGSGSFSDTELAVMSAMSRQAGVAIGRSRLVDDLRTLFVGAIRAIIKSLEARDPYTRGHSVRVTLFSLAIADRLGWTAKRRDLLELGGLMHDIGKIGIPERILHKPDRLNDEEYNIIKTHPDIGAGILSSMPTLHRLVTVRDVINAVRHHHEAVNGTGYPDQLAGDEIPETARIIAIADTYDAISTDRPYQKRRSGNEVLAIMRETLDKRLDRKLFLAFEELIWDGLADTLEKVTTRFHIQDGLEAGG